MADLLVGIWSVNTTSQDQGAWITKSFDKKLGELRAALDQFARYRSRFDNFEGHPRDANRIRAVFAAPEYLFAPAEGEHNDRRYYEKVSGLPATAKLKRYIPSSHNALIVPGSIAHLKARTAARQTKYDNGIAASGNVPDEANRRAGLARDNKTRYARNTAYGMYEGRKVIACHKQSDATDAFADGERAVWVPGYGTNRYNAHIGRSAAPKSIGIEICADSSNLAAQGYRTPGAQVDMDVKILLSAVLQANHVYVNYADLLIHACSDRTHSGVTTRGAVQSQRVVNRNFGGHPFEVFEVRNL